MCASQATSGKGISHHDPNRGLVRRYRAVVCGSVCGIGCRVVFEKGEGQMNDELQAAIHAVADCQSKIEMYDLLVNMTQDVNPVASAAYKRWSKTLKHRLNHEEHRLAQAVLLLHTSYDLALVPRQKVQ